MIFLSHFILSFFLSCRLADIMISRRVSSSILRKPAAVHEVFRCRESGELDLVLLRDVLALDDETQALVEADGL